MKNLKKISREGLRSISGSGILSTCSASCGDGVSVSITCSGACVANDGQGAFCTGGGSAKCPAVNAD